MTAASSQDGPLVSEKVTTIHHYMVEKLPPWLLDSLYSLINESFSSAHKDFNKKRLQSPKQIVQELGTGSFLYALTSHDDTGSEIVICSCSARPFTGEVKPGSRFDRGPLPNAKDEVTWEIKFLVTLPTMQGQGLASLLLSLVEKELVRMTRSCPDVKILRIVLSTLLEANSAFYTARGWTLTKQTHVPLSDSDLGTAFTIAFMDKIIALDS